MDHLISPAADVYALGVLLWQVGAPRVPCHGLRTPCQPRIALRRPANSLAARGVLRCGRQQSFFFQRTA